MSFGFGVGDFLAVFQLVNQIRKDFAGAPSEFSGALDVVRSLSVVLLDVAAAERELSPKEETDLLAIRDGCQNTLTELKRTLEKYTGLESRQASFGGKVKRVWKRLALEPEDIRNLRSRITNHIALLNTFLLRQTRDDTTKLVRYQENQEQRAISQEEQAILDWITPVDYFPQQNDFFKQRQAGTGQWLLDSTEFETWVKTKKQTLFCPGIPGAGKTILTSIVVNELEIRFQNDGSTALAYLYCNFKRQDEQKLEDLLASLVKQLLKGRPLPESVRSLYDRCRAKTRPSIDDLTTVLQSIVAEYSQVFILVDALDECRAQDGCRTQMLSKLFDVQAKWGINLFATSRFIPEIMELFMQSPRLEIRANEQDVWKYIDGRISLLPSFVRNNLDLQQEIRTEIVKAVDGMFLLARLHLDSLIGKKSIKAIRSALTKLPAGTEAYDSAYNAAMERIEGQLPEEKDLAKQVLSWIICAKRQLNTRELQHALAVEIDEVELDEDNISPIENMVSVCAGLVIVDEESSIIRLVHYTTQEYFKRTQQHWFPTAEVDITTICATYLLFNDFESGSCPTDPLFEKRLLLNPLYDYTTHYWGQHACQASTLCPKVLEFLQCTIKVEAAAQAMLARKYYTLQRNYSQNGPSQVTGLHIAAHFGIIETVAVILHIVDVNVDSKDSSNDTPLSWAAREGHEAVVKLLLDSGKIDVNSNNGHGQTPLSWAASRGHTAVIKLLLDTGKVDVDSKDGDSQTPLSYAARGGHEAVVKLLLNTGKVDVDLKDTKFGQTPLSWAAEEGHEAVVKLLFDTGKVDVDSKDGDSQTPLSYAARGGHEAVVKLLLNTGKVDVDLKDTKFGLTPLSWAAEEGHEAVVKLLLNSGKVDVDSKDSEYGRTPLSWAAGAGHEAVIKLLLDTGKVDVDSKASYSQTPLLYAARGGHEAVVKLLLDTGKVDVDSKDGDSQTPLSYAVRRGHEAVVKLLLNTGEVDVDLKDTKFGQTPLSWAAEEGHEAVVKLLFDTGKVDVDSKDDYSQTPLLHAARGGHEAVVKLLLNTGKVDVDLKDTNYGQTPLSWAAEEGHEAVVKLLFDTGKVDVDSRSTTGKTPLSWAARGGHEAVVKLLLDTGKVDVDSKDGDSQTPLSYAARGGHEAVVKLLLDTGKVDVDLKDTKYGQTPLAWAAEEGHEAVIKLLLDTGNVDVNSRSTTGQTPLSWAAENGHEAVVRLLQSIM